MTESYQDSIFRQLFDKKGKGASYDRAVLGEEDYVAHSVIAKGLAKKVADLSLPTPKTVVAFAIGTGLETGELKKIFKDTHIVGVDMSIEMMKVANRKNRADEFHQNDITEETSVQAQSADIVMCCGGTEFNPGKLQNIADEMMRVAKPGALIAITFRPEGQEAARPGLAYYTQDQMNEAFSAATFLSAEEGRAFTMQQQSTQDAQDTDTKNVDVIYGTSYFQMPSGAPA